MKIFKERLKIFAIVFVILMLLSFVECVLICGLENYAEVWPGCALLSAICGALVAGYAER